ncbi:tyrosine-type recombinase/integrase [Aurantibacter aestuarii]|uniref:Integrase n=1 Tax=Aurantibacter aestuarii TaxID=1266046 RepID=A0A2T1N743_9FLAO|nr:site-specific integrase [Aurantibacter aestuarii]PSG87385.1 integrase [Aurantibacter aestuarii]
METSQKKICLIDYLPAELKENKRWEIVYYVKNPFTEKLERKQVRVKPLKNKTERRKIARRMIVELNKRLERGFNPFINETEHKGFNKFIDVSKIFIKRIEIEVKNGDKRIDTLRSYRSFLNNINNYIIECGNENMFVVKFDADFVNEFLDVIYYDRENSARTRNNYLHFIKTFSDWLIRNSYISKNPCLRIETMTTKTKTRVVIPDDLRKEIFKYLKKLNYGYYVMCLTCYYCLIRRTEMTKLKVSDIVLKNGIIYVDKETAKNKKSQPVTIPDALIPILVEHLKNAKQTDYLFSSNFDVGKTQLKPKKISDEWDKMRSNFKLENKYQWYSLKDTGITNLLKAGVPLISVRDQARHHSSLQTDAYTPKEILKANENIRNAEIN